MGKPKIKGSISNGVFSLISLMTGKVCEEVISSRFEKFLPLLNSDSAKTAFSVVGVGAALSANVPLVAVGVAATLATKLSEHFFQSL